MSLRGPQEDEITIERTYGRCIVRLLLPAVLTLWREIALLSLIIATVLVVASLGGVVRGVWIAVVRVGHDE